MDLPNAVALVTGGSGGLGSRICSLLANEGANVAIGYLHELLTKQMRNHCIYGAHLESVTGPPPGPTVAPKVPAGIGVG